MTAAPLLTSAEAAAVIGVKEHTLRVWRGAGRGPAFVKLGNGRVRYTEDAIAAWVAANTRGGSDGR